jgi:membrane-associated phospholipid phosphatase
MKFRLLMIGAASFCLWGGFARADSASTVVTAGNGVAIALPLIAGGISLYKNDNTGLAEMGLDTFLTVGTAFGLSHIVREERPDHSDDRSFPSDTEALAFAPAAFLWDRYGWKYGVPAYAAAAFVGYARVDGQKHHWWDVVASAGIGWTYSEIFTTRFHPDDRLSAVAYPTSGGAMVAVRYRW